MNTPDTPPPRQGFTARHPRLAMGLGALVGFGLLAWLWPHLAQAPLWEMLQRPALWPVLALSALLWWSSYFLRALRLKLEWRDRAALDLGGCWRAVMRHNLALALLPMRLGEAGYLWELRRRWGIDWREAGRSLLWLRLQDVAVLATLAGGVWGLPLLLAHAWGAPLLVVAALAAALTWRWRERLPARLGAALREAWRAGSHRDGAAASWACCVGNWLAKLCATGLLLGTLAQGSDGIYAAAAWFAGALAGEWAGALPLQAPAGVGTYEAALLWGARPSGAGDAALVAAALLTHAAALATLVLGATLTALVPEGAAPRSRDA